MKIFVLAALVVAATSFDNVVSAPSSELGNQLASQLGLDDPWEAQRAVDELATARRLGLSAENEEPLDEELLARKAAASSKLDSANPQEALESLSELTKELDQRIKLPGTGNNLLALTAEAHLDRASALRLLNRPVEALVEAQKVRSICSKARCSPGANANNVIHAIEDELASKDSYALFGLAKGASAGQVSKARRNLLLLLHPDKNRAADKQTSNYLQHLYDKIEAAYKVISSEQK